jgi:phosphatidylinositol-3-phosphatase
MASVGPAPLFYIDMSVYRLLTDRSRIFSIVRFRLLALACTVLAFAGCVGQVAKTPPPPPPPGQSTPRFGHVFIVVEENTNYSDVIANPSMPYLNSLANQYGLATNYFANLHPSIPNYFELTTGKILTIIDSETPQSFPVSDDNVVHELLAAGKTWKSYAEDLPVLGYTGGDKGNYAVRHNPLAYMRDVQNNPAQTQNLVPFSQFPADLPTANLPDYSFIVPNLCNDAHDCPLSTADTWLHNNIDPLINSPQFQKDGLLIIVFDEANNLDLTSGGGHVAAVIISPFAKHGYKSIAFYQHQSVLRLMLEGLGVTKLPGDAASAPPMWEFFNAP